VICCAFIAGGPYRRPAATVLRLMVAGSSPAPPPPQTQRFAPLDWALVAGVALTWGSSFLLIEIAIEHFEPAVVALLRLVFGAASLAVVPAARRGVQRADWPMIALLGVLWMAVPFLLLPSAQQQIDSSLAGMINAAAPLFGAAVAALLTRSLPGPARAAGLLIGFLGVAAITAPELDGAQASGAGVGLVLLATVMYGISFNITGPLLQRSGALPVIWRAQLAALAVDLPFGLASIPASDFAWSSLLACAAMGAVGTALAYVWFAVLLGRVGSTRGSITIYFIPAVAIVLGALLLDETITGAAVAGTALVVVGAYVVSRSR
jgi:drug/metabolite transporter (DMT)-like permease